MQPHRVYETRCGFFIGSLKNQTAPMWPASCTFPVHDLPPTINMLRALLLITVCLTASGTHALTAAQARGMAIGDSASRIEALNKAATDSDENTTAFIQALADDAVKTSGESVFVMKDGQATDPVTGAAFPMPGDAEDVTNNNLMRGELDNALAALQLLSKDQQVRASAIKILSGGGYESRLPLIEKAFAAETVPALRSQLELMRAAIFLASSDKAKRIEAAKRLAGSNNPISKTVLIERIALEADPEVKRALQTSLASVDAALAWGDKLGAIFSGISMGSILLLVALGLAITYGLMGVINMAHGELMMIGAYATYVTQGLFQKYLPGFFDWYLLAAVPAAFLAAALMGVALERGVIRFLYGRPLETLLATWGMSLMLQQLVRSIFGAQNVAVENPVWMSGGLQVLGNLSLPYNRLVIIAFAIAVLLGMAWLISRTRLGLFVRGVTQNRPIASCMGVNTARVDTYAFALGSGVAGLAGCALSQVGNVGPDLGQGYIVDAFMVVVLGGVGQLAGTVYAAMGLGILNKFLEGWTGAVLAKIAVLVLIIIFIQKRPQGIFAVKGRSVEV